ncbi:MAG: phosphate-starvation-inducible PsiE family protein [Actinomycetota bacterium]|nr:phosphate-starvation-inducible PsiE family protein [Actinomycetota bacterium]
MAEGAEGKEEEPRARVVAASVWLLEHAQDFVSVIVGVVLIVLAGAELISGIIDFFADVNKTSLDPAGINLLDRVLLVLILVEIVHTVVLSLRAHHLVAQPFIIVGLVAVIRKILVVLSGTGTIPTPQLALLVAMVFVFVAALLAVTWFDRRSKQADPEFTEQEIS